MNNKTDLQMFNVLNFVTLMNKKVWQDIYLELSCTVCLYSYSIATHFPSRNRLIYRRKTKDDKNFMMWMLELFMDVDKLVDIRHWWKKKDLAKTFALFAYIATHFSPRNGLIYQRKTKDDKNCIMWMLGLFTDVDKLLLVINI